MNQIPEKAEAPFAEKIPKTFQKHGVSWQDDYFWLRQRENPKVLEYLKAENTYTESIFAPCQALQEKLYQEILSRIKETDMSVPARKGDYFYYSRTEKGKQYSIYCRKFRSLEAPEEILLDVNELAQGKAFCSLGILAVSPDHRFLAYAVDYSGEETYTLKIRNLGTGEELPEILESLSPSCQWAADNKTLFYVTLDEAKRPFKLWRHRLGEAQSSDSEIFHETDESFFVSVDKTRDEKYLLLDSSSKTSSEVHYLEAACPEKAWTLIQKRLPNLEYSISHHEGRFLIVTNDGALNFKIAETPVQHPSREHWKDFLPHREDVRVDDIDVFKEYLVIYERSQGLQQIQIIFLPKKEAHRIAFEEAVYTLDEGNNPEFETASLRFHYSSLVTPDSVIDYDMHSHQKTVQKIKEVRGGYGPSQYQSERIFAKSPDGTPIPVSLVYRKGMSRNGNNPLFLYGYGAYGISLDPYFSSARLSLLDRGFIFAMAHIRGGEELGRSWYDAGKLERKKNSFLDFIACAEFLVQEKYTAPDKLVISGGSAGGLLMGAVVNLRPELFAGVIMHVPFVDVLNTMLDKTLPLTVMEFEEWGNPEDQKAFDTIRAYSPYDNIRPQAYPPMFVTAGLNDPRVQYWEPAKWVARLRALKTDQNLLLLKTHMGAGHQGASGRYDYLREIAQDYAFFLMILKISEPEPVHPAP